MTILRDNNPHLGRPVGSGDNTRRPSLSIRSDQSLFLLLSPAELVGVTEEGVLVKVPRESDHNDANSEDERSEEEPLLLKPEESHK